MLEIKDGKKILTTPVSAEELKDIHAGDIIYLNGSMTTCRDVAHRRLVEEGRELPVDVKDAAIFHAGPIIRPLENDKFEMVSVGPTTSMRMEKFEYEFVKESGVRVIIGKGGMKENTERACKEFGEFIVYSQQEMLLLQQQKLRKSLMLSGETLECLRHCGTAA